MREKQECRVKPLLSMQSSGTEAPSADSEPDLFGYSRRFLRGNPSLRGLRESGNTPRIPRSPCSPRDLTSLVKDPLGFESKSSLATVDNHLDSDRLAT
jgi:hypothetical protein